MNLPGTYLLLLLCFFLSGFAALLYETAWTREFAFVFGTSELAVVSVLAAYMGGLAAGAALASRIAARTRRPVMLYGLLELAIALSALAVPYAIRGVSGLYVGLRGGLDTLPDEGQLAGSLFYLGASFLILLPPTAAMGATLPLLARHAVRTEEEIGRRIGVLYAINTAGAIAGTLVAGFLLLPRLGLRDTVYVGAGINALVFALAALLARRSAPLPAPGSTPEKRTATDGAGTGAAWVLPAIALSGAVSFTYEVLWTRLLGHVVGGSLYAFATMLASFLGGIALGSALASRLATDPRRAGTVFAAAQVVAAATSLAAFAAVDRLPGLARALGAGSHGSLWSNVAFAACVLLPPAVAVGATFPTAVRLLAHRPEQAAGAAARVYACNTLGAIGGAIAAGFVLLPAIGYERTLAVGAAANLGLALVAALFVAAARPVIPFALAGLGALVLVPPATPWSLLRASPINGQQSPGHVIFFGVGRSATVLALADFTGWRLKTNGLPEAKLLRQSEVPGQFLLSRWLGLLPVLGNPDTRSILIVGLGGSGALEAVPRTVESIDVVELEEQVVAANRAIALRRGVDPLSDPRVSVHLNDARGALMLTDARWDAIVSQPSHPWTAGASHLYTREFFALAESRLAPGGVFVQWIGFRFVDEALLRSLVATLVDVFPAVRVYYPSSGGVLFFASEARIPVEQRAGRALAAAPDDFARYGILTREDVAAALVLDEAGSRAFGRPPLITDDHNRLASASALLAGRGLLFPTVRHLLAPHDPLAALLESDGGLDAVTLVRRVLSISGRGRAEHLARALPDAPTRDSAIGWTELGKGNPRAALRSFDSALAGDPQAAGARFGVIKAERRMAGAVPRTVSTAGLGRTEKVVVAGWAFAGRGDWESVRALDEALAAADPRDPGYSDAVRLRIEWRVASGNEERGEEALGIADRLLPREDVPTDYLLRARAATVAGRPFAALSGLEEVALRLRRTRAPAAGALRRQCLALLDRLPANARAESLRRSLEEAER